MDTSLGRPSQNQWLAANAGDAGHVDGSTDVAFPRSKGDTVMRRHVLERGSRPPVAERLR